MNVHLNDGETEANSNNKKAKITVSCKIKTKIGDKESKELIYRSYDKDGENVVFNNCNYTFDHVFDKSTTLNDIFEKTTINSINTALNCNNASVIVYGNPIGIDKAELNNISIGNFTDGMNSKDAGIIPRAFEDLFSKIKTDKDNKYSVFLGYIAISSEVITDLLEQENDNIVINEVQEGLNIEGMQWVKVTCSKDCLIVFEEGVELKNSFENPSEAEMLIFRIEKASQQGENKRSFLVFANFARFPNTTATQIFEKSITHSPNNEDIVKESKITRLLSGTFTCTTNTSFIISLDASTKDVKVLTDLLYLSSKAKAMTKQFNINICEVTDYKKLSTKLQNDYDHLSENFIKVKQQNNELVNALDIEKIKANDLEKQIQNTKSKQTTRNNITDIEIKKTEDFYEKKLKEQEVELNILHNIEKSLIEQMKTDLKLALEENQRLKEALNDYKSKHEDNVLIFGVNDETQFLEETINFLKDENNSLIIENKSLKSESRSLKAENNSLKSENISLKSEINTLKINENTNYNNLKNENSTLKVEIKTLKSEINILKNEMNIITVNNINLKTEDDSLKNEINSLRKENSAIIAENVALREQNNTIHREITIIKEEYSTIITEYNSLKIINNITLEENNTLKSENNNLKCESHEMQNYNSVANINDKYIDIKTYNEEVEKLHKEITELTQRLKEKQLKSKKVELNTKHSMSVVKSPVKVEQDDEEEVHEVKKSKGLKAAPKRKIIKEEMLDDEKELLDKNELGFKSTKASSFSQAFTAPEKATQFSKLIIVNNINEILINTTKPRVTEQTEETISPNKSYNYEDKEEDDDKEIHIILLNKEIIQLKNLLANKNKRIEEAEALLSKYGNIEIELKTTKRELTTINYSIKESKSAKQSKDSLNNFNNDFDTRSLGYKANVEEKLKTLSSLVEKLQIHIKNKETELEISKILENKLKKKIEENNAKSMDVEKKYENLKKEYSLLKYNSSERINHIEMKLIKKSSNSKQFLESFAEFYFDNNLLLEQIKEFLNLIKNENKNNFSQDLFQDELDFKFLDSNNYIHYLNKINTLNFVLHIDEQINYDNLYMNKLFNCKKQNEFVEYFNDFMRKVINLFESCLKSLITENTKLLYFTDSLNNLIKNYILDKFDKNKIKNESVMYKKLCKNLNLSESGQEELEKNNFLVEVNIIFLILE